MVSPASGRVYFIFNPVRIDYIWGRKMAKETSVKKEPNKEHIYFSMNAPNWFVNKPVDEKCEIVEALAEQLKGVKPITAQQKKELFSIG
jgi:hypothetical protein